MLARQAVGAHLFGHGVTMEHPENERTAAAPNDAKPSQWHSVASALGARWVDDYSPRDFALALVVVVVALVVLFALACSALGWAQSCNWNQFLRITIAAGSISLACGGGGALLGFLFGLPRSLPATSDRNRGLHGYLDNTNLLDVSDWLTKIIVGLSLVQIGKLPSAIGQLGRALAPALGYSPDGKYACATAATSEGAIAGIGVTMCLTALVFAFMIGYLWARVTFTRLLRDSDMTDSTADGDTSPAANEASGPQNPEMRQ
jgi:hypothetical protein